MRRREFLGTFGAAVATGMITRRAASEPIDEALARGPKSNAPRLPMREYGKTGIRLSIIGFPGFALRDTTEKDQARTNRLVAETIERGVNYFDVAAQYGNAEAVLGPALQPYRKHIFLSSKTSKRTAEEAAKELDRSLQRLKTDYLDLYNLHHIQHLDRDVDVAFGKGGAMEVLIQAKKEGRVRHLGFSAHSIEAALAAMDRYDFDSAIFPINFACIMKGNWGRQIIERCQAKGVAMFALKALARQQWPKDDPKRSAYPICWYQPLTDLDEAEMALRFTLSQPIVAALPPSSDRLHRLAMILGMDFQPITAEQEKKLAQLAEGLNPVFKQA
ncbi:MAG TPA: aldo/keto reductase [Phycisphaerae bacterium]|nr:aldo/keto reductase [Phycisphaerae bacterium]HOJ73737.1 aldo/keto reductase [Phycisphaerae bacterium]HOM50384.1 aldo/keto reductase [Phycisphaerae bacterium]HOQ84204.1 aldo/keto reductase [Phycisphaerae bacterium]HPP27293.1 aldo/keto reductase [Phycisphaerae bacterium]